MPRRCSRSPAITAASRAPVTSSATSRSARTTCWWWATMRVFTVVGRAPSETASAGTMPSARSASRTRSPAASWPITPTSTASPPRARRLAATLPAPPRWKLWPVTSTTGTGASGEMRATLPQMNSSSMRSPRTSTRRPRMARSRRSARVLESEGMTRDCMSEGRPLRPPARLSPLPGRARARGLPRGSPRALAPASPRAPLAPSGGRGRAAPATCDPRAAGRRGWRWWRWRCGACPTGPRSRPGRPLPGAPAAGQSRPERWRTNTFTRPRVRTRTQSLGSPSVRRISPGPRLSRGSFCTKPSRSSSAMPSKRRQARRPACARRVSGSARLSDHRRGRGDAEEAPGLRASVLRPGGEAVVGRGLLASSGRGGRGPRRGGALAGRRPKFFRALQEARSPSRSGRAARGRRRGPGASVGLPPPVPRAGTP